MIDETESGYFAAPQDTGDDFIDSFQLPVRFTEHHTEHARRITDVSRGIRNATYVERWSRKRELGRGGFGTVYLESDTGRTGTVYYLREVLAMAHFTKVNPPSE